MLPGSLVAGVTTRYALPLSGNGKPATPGDFTSFYGAGRRGSAPFSHSLHLQLNLWQCLPFHHQFLPFACPSPALSPIETGPQQPLSGRPPPRFASHLQLHLSSSVRSNHLELTFLPRFKSRSLHFRPPNSPILQWLGENCTSFNHSAISGPRHRSLKYSP